MPAGWAGKAMLAMAAMGLVLAGAARAAVEATTPDGRRVLLEDNGTWRYVDSRPCKFRFQGHVT
ncbi:MAG: hypothetical protein KJZ81_16795 [Burkholderiaceae bacterium]|nr:hypothetical protein [Burkholderiaceae bacterium]